jgi:glycogen operon protein
MAFWVEGVGEAQLYASGSTAVQPEWAIGTTGTSAARSLRPRRYRNFNGTFRRPGYDPDSPQADLSFSDWEQAPGAPKSIVVDSQVRLYDRQLGTPLQNSVIYELHVKGFTHHPSSEVAHGGTFKGLAEKIPYLKDLGVTAVELMPVQEFDEDENVLINPLTGEKLKNFWGYSTLSFSPQGTISSACSSGEQYSACKEMVRDLHNAGIEVILTSYSTIRQRATTSPDPLFRGIDNSVY